MDEKEKHIKEIKEQEEKKERSLREKSALDKRYNYLQKEFRKKLH